VLGVDPGLERMGYGFVTREGSRLVPGRYGLIETPRIGISDRLLLLHEGLLALIDEEQPTVLATEKLFFSVNKRTAMDVAKAVGVILLAGAERNLPWSELSPPEIKLGVVGNGAADKKQIQFMVTRLLGLTETPKPDDVADALAIAIARALRGV